MTNWRPAGGSRAKFQDSRFGAPTVSRGYFPLYVSAPSMMPSTPSSTALAMSVASALHRKPIAGDSDHWSADLATCGGLELANVMLSWNM